MFSFGPNVPTVDAEDLKKALDEHSDAVILDVRTPQEFSKGKIPSAVNLPLNKVSHQAEHFLPDKDKTIYVYCLSGSRSIIAVSQMMKLGYKNVKNVASGLLAWRAKQYPLVP